MNQVRQSRSSSSSSSSDSGNTTGGGSPHAVEISTHDRTQRPSLAGMETSQQVREFVESQDTSPNGRDERQEPSTEPPPSSALQMPHATKAATVEQIANGVEKYDEDPISNRTNVESLAIHQPVAVDHGGADKNASPDASGSTADSTNMNAGTGVDSGNVDPTVSPPDTRSPSNMLDGVIGSVNYHPDGSQILSKLSSRGWEWSWRWAWIDENTEDIILGAS